jgi:hypothetical protein
VLEGVNRRLCEVLTELSEDVVAAMDAGASGAAASTGTGEGEEQSSGGGAAPAARPVDYETALAAYGDALTAILREKETKTQVRGAGWGLWGQLRSPAWSHIRAS